MDFTEAKEKKPAIIAIICKEQVDQAVKYLEDNYAPTQAALLRSEFLKIEARCVSRMASCATGVGKRLFMA